MLFEICREQGTHLKRFGIYRERSFLFSVSGRTYHKAVKPNLPLTEDDLTTIADYEKNYLQEGLAQYLCRAERAPAAVKRWLAVRKLPPAWQTWLYSSAEQQNLLSEKRYAELFLLDAARRGHKGPFVLKQELRRRGISEKYINLDAYDAESALSCFLRFKKTKPVMNDKLVRKLRARGYAYRTIAKVCGREND